MKADWRAGKWFIATTWSYSSGNMSKKKSGIQQLLEVMARLRAPDGCPWDREQDHMTLRFYAVEEVYELMDAIEASDDHELEEELGDLLLQVVFHCQLARERGAFDFERVCQRIVNKLIHRHPHVFGKNKLDTAEAVLVQWEKLKRAEKTGTKHERPSALDGIPKHLPALLRAQELVKKARRAKIVTGPPKANGVQGKSALGRELFDLAERCQAKGWNPEALLRAETQKRERTWRQRERAQAQAEKRARRTR
jgi:XTP/dITP diphosphohydrolase